METFWIPEQQEATESSPLLLQRERSLTCDRANKVKGIGFNLNARISNWPRRKLRDIAASITGASFRIFLLYSPRLVIIFSRKFRDTFKKQCLQSGIIYSGR